METTADNLKSQALKAYYEHKLQQSEKEDAEKKQYEIDKAQALEELKAKFPGLTEENDVYDIVGYKFQISFGYGKKGKVIAYFELVNGDLVSKLISEWVTDLVSLGSVIDKYTKEQWNQYAPKTEK